MYDKIKPLETTDLVSYGTENCYLKKWKDELNKDKSFKSFVSFILPLMAIPLAVKGVKMGIEAIQKYKEEKEAEK